MSRLIDADALIEKCGDWYVEEGTESGFIGTLENLLATQPTVQPEPHWIPVTEPPKGDFMPYYATCRSKVDDRENWVIEGMYTKYSGWEYPPMVRDDRAEIIAWMPKELPEPYKGVTE